MEAYAMQLGKGSHALCYGMAIRGYGYLYCDLYRFVKSCPTARDCKRKFRTVTAIQGNGNVREIKENLKKLLGKESDFEVRDMATRKTVFRYYYGCQRGNREALHDRGNLALFSSDAVRMSPSYFSSIFSKEAREKHL